MDIKEALDYIEDLIEFREEPTDKCVQALRIAHSATKKQKSKKPKGDYNSCPHHRCPTCNGAVRMYCDDEYNPYCQFCGQALDWSDEE